MSISRRIENARKLFKARGKRIVLQHWVEGLSRDIELLRHTKKELQNRCDRAEYREREVIDIVKNLTGGELSPIKIDLDSKLKAMHYPVQRPYERINPIDNIPRGESFEVVSLSVINLAVGRDPVKLSAYVELSATKDGREERFCCAVSDEFLEGNRGLNERQEHEMAVKIAKSLSRLYRKKLGYENA